MNDIQHIARRTAAADVLAARFIQRAGVGRRRRSPACRRAARRRRSSRAAPAFGGVRRQGAPAATIAPGGTAQSAGGVLKAALTGEPDTLDPATSAIYTGAQVYDNIFSKLIDIDTDG